MKPPMYEICARIKPLSLANQIHHIRALLKLEKPRSVRAFELQSLLVDRMTKQLKREVRAA